MNPFLWGAQRKPEAWPVRQGLLPRRQQVVGLCVKRPGFPLVWKLSQAGLIRSIDASTSCLQSPEESGLEPEYKRTRCSGPHWPQLHFYFLCWTGPAPSSMQKTCFDSRPATITVCDFSLQGSKVSGSRTLSSASLGSLPGCALIWAAGKRFLGKIPPNHKQIDHTNWIGPSPPPGAGKPFSNPNEQQLSSSARGAQLAQSALFPGGPLRDPFSLSDFTQAPDDRCLGQLRNSQEPWSLLGSTSRAHIKALHFPKERVSIHIYNIYIIYIIYIMYIYYRYIIDILYI